MFDSFKRGIRRTVRRIVASAAVLLTGHYDASKTTKENSNHWRNAKRQPATLLNSPDTRQKLRTRAGYEYDNNCYMQGLVSTLGKDLIGVTLPRLQVSTGFPELDKLLESSWNKWSKDSTVNLSHALKLLDKTKRVEGEGFLAFTDDMDTLANTGISLNVCVISPSRVADPMNFMQGFVQNGMLNDDGVVVDVYTGRPVIFKVHQLANELLNPGLYGSIPVLVDSYNMLQWFDPKRPDQYRGVCELAPALDTYAQMRRYEDAVLGAAEFAASLAGVMKTNAPPQDGPTVVDQFTQFPLVKNMLLSLPEGWDAQQFEPRQPITSHEMFINVQLRKIGRLLDMPFGVVAGDSSRYNYSSARLDYLGYDNGMNYDKEQLATRILNPLFREFAYEFLLSNLLPTDLLNQMSVTWYFSKRPSIDPNKDIDAAISRIDSFNSNLQTECAINGDDWKDIVNQRLDELEYIQTQSVKRGLTIPQTSSIMNNKGSVPPATDTAV